MKAIRFYVPGTPKAQKRPRANSINGHARMYQPKPTEWRQRIAVFAMQHRPPEPLEGPIRVDCVFVFPRPKGHYGTGRNARNLKPSAPRVWHESSVDRDNLDKALLDELEACGFFRNDAQVCSGEPSKAWCDAGLPSGAYIRIQREEGCFLPDYVYSLAANLDRQPIGATQ